jgi:branched-chain amino acid aminotransferase
MKVWLDGQLLDQADAKVPYDDHAITVGDAAFETIKLVHGRPFALRRHLDRLDRSLTSLMLAPPARPEIEAAIDAVLSEPAEGFLRITVTGGQGPLGSPRADVSPRLIVAIRPGKIQELPTEVIVVDWVRNERGALTGVKSTSYAENVVALARATEAGASEALFANTVGNLCEGTGANVFVGFGSRLVTPPLSAGCLAGINRELLIEAMGPAVEVDDIPMSDLDTATEMFLTSTGREAQPVRRIDERALPTCPGPLTQAAAKAWTDAYGDPATGDP